VVPEDVDGQVRRTVPVHDRERLTRDGDRAGLDDGLEILIEQEARRVLTRRQELRDVRGIEEEVPDLRAVVVARKLEREGHDAVRRDLLVTVVCGRDVDEVVRTRFVLD
jgi:hypothetical protein